MTCRDLEELLSAYVDGELSRTQKEFIEEHLSSCADCRATLASFVGVRDQLISLRATSRPGDMKGEIISKIKTENVLNKPKAWLRPVLIGVPIAAVLAVALTLFFTVSSRQPQDVLASAVANTQNLTSFRVYDFAEYRQPESADWVTTYYKEVDYGGPGLIHTKSRFTSSFSDNSTGWQSAEFIISGNSVYLWGSTPPLTYSTQSINKGWAEQVSSLQQPADYLKLLASTKRMPDAEIDGTTCSYYESMVNMDAWVKQQLADAQERARLTNSSWTEQRAKALEALWRTRQVQLEFWIGKDDHTMHQWRMTDTQAPEAKTNMSPEDARETIRYYDFGKEITVGPPLNAQGNLLSGWRLQSGQ